MGELGEIHQIPGDELVDWRLVLGLKMGWDCLSMQLVLLYDPSGCCAHAWLGPCLDSPLHGVR